ncbi:hypothetical protein CC85DRAFT_283045 [Cutaneotrichosporon oleaginosum]|uniref:Uncharacterized protein n=1 Tax=Cutaneotrichosporon oleaginosum TaxID=879819 RepID=A0A0J0XVP2_9TREE|nr:uncharacterized protein CC85DRAFT_283045 [Cutaneotrichosporon oleaginosum]KLT45131.1 hypothetical protein CC85DRAFT_283045 [Cutaneotrichosporon oleaginosum]TXT09811.1 hypothetical protein COLE_03745 [Cutaneotrichosporon oleaginosum]
MYQVAGSVYSILCATPTNASCKCFTERSMPPYVCYGCFQTRHRPFTNDIRVSHDRGTTVRSPIAEEYLKMPAVRVNDLSRVFLILTAPTEHGATSSIPLINMSCRR